MQKWNNRLTAVLLCELSQVSASYINLCVEKNSSQLLFALSGTAFFFLVCCDWRPPGVRQVKPEKRFMT